MPALQQDLTIEQGTDWAEGWAVTVATDGVAFEAIDDTWSARSQVRQFKSSEAVLHTFAATVDAEGNVVIGVTAAESSVWAWREGRYDVEVVNADESLTLRVAEGKVTVDAEVTR